MVLDVERPLDLLNSLKGKSVIVSFREDKCPLEAELVAFDIHINIVVKVEKKFRFIRGDNILSIE